MSYRIDSLADGCYPGTACLINKFGIREEEKLAFVESRIVLGKTEQLQNNPLLFGEDGLFHIFLGIVQAAFDSSFRASHGFRNGRNTHFIIIRE